MNTWQYLFGLSIGLGVLWLVGRIDDWLIKKEQRNASTRHAK